jgi:hypothetical protein
VNDPSGSVRDPYVDYDGRRILFSYRRSGSEYFHLYEIQSDGSGLKQLTDGPWDDIEPCYAPDGNIIFGSSRARRWVPCNDIQVATIYWCDADGNNIRMLSPNVENDNTPWPLTDGRILYERWEYVDRSQMHFHHLWVMNPDGTNQMVYYGNMHPRHAFLDAKPIPGSDNIVMIQSPEHGETEHRGAVSILDPKGGPDDLSANRVIANGSFRDPYPLSPDSILVVDNDRLFLMNGNGDRQELYRLGGELGDGSWLNEPRPLRPRPREPVIPSRVDLTKTTGTLILMDTYIGRNMRGVNRGDIKKLLIMEILPKPVNFEGQMWPITVWGSFFIKRIIGTVPVEADGSAHMELPANRALQFAVLDQDDLAVKYMCSFLSVAPGEVTTCIGCHEDRTMAVPNMPVIQALQRPASRPEPIANMPEIFDYPRDIQPIWDRHCLDCHGTEQYDGRMLMTGDQGRQYTHSYYMLHSRMQVADGRDLARGNYPPRTIGSAGSPLINKVDGSHYNVQLSAQELRLVKLWIDASGTFAGTYGALATGEISGNWSSVDAARDVMERRCNGCHRDDMRLPSSPTEKNAISPPGNTGSIGYGETYSDRYPDSPGWQWAPAHEWTPPWVEPYGDGSLRIGSYEWMKRYAEPRLQFASDIIYNLSYPEQSVQLLAPLARSAGGYGICGDIFTSTGDEDFQRLLRCIQDARQRLLDIGRFNMPDFRPRRMYISEMKRWGVLPESFDLDGPIDVYETDRQYWESLYPGPYPVTTSVVRRK